MLTVLATALMSACNAQPPAPAPTVPATQAAPRPTLEATRDDMAADPPLGDVAGNPGASAAAKQAVVAARERVAKVAGVGDSELEVVRVEEVRWPDGTFTQPGGPTPRPNIVIRGYRILITAGQKSYEVRTDLVGERMVVVPR